MNNKKVLPPNCSLVSFRAECEYDWIELEKALKKKQVDYELVSRGENIEDCKFELKLFNATIDDVFECMCGLNDAHVMYETIRPVVLAENSLERRYHGTTKPKYWMGDPEFSEDVLNLVKVIKQEMNSGQ